MKKKKMTYQEKLEINTEVKEFVTYFCNLLDAARLEEEAHQASILASDEESYDERYSFMEDKYKIEYVRDSMTMRSSILSRKYEIICSLLPTRLSTQDFFVAKSNLTEEGEAILELYKRLKEGGMEYIKKEMEAATKKRRAESLKEPHKISSDLKSLKQKRMQYELSALNEKLLAEEKRKLYIASTLTEKDLLLTKESLVEPSEKYPKPRPSERMPLYEVCKNRLRKTGLPTTEEVCRLSSKKEADEELEIDDDIYRFIEDEEKVLHAYNIWMKSYFGYHRKSVRNRFKERVIKTIKTINLDSDDDESYFTAESSEGSAIADSSCDSLDDEEEHKIKEIFLKEDINRMMLTLEDKIRKERTPLTGMELKNNELKMMWEDSSIETTSDDSEEKYDPSAVDSIVDLEEVLEKERTIIPNMELTINHLLDEKVNSSKSLYELYYNMVNLSVKKEEIRQKLLNESDWKLEKGAFLSGVEYLKENSSDEAEKSEDKALVNSQYEIIKNMSEQDNSLVLHLMEADHKMRKAAEERLENEEEFRQRKELMHEYEVKIRAKVGKLRNLIRRKIHRRLNKLLGQRQKFKQYKDSDSVCSFYSESIDTTLTDVTREIAFLQSFNEELEKEDTRTSDKLYKALTRKCEKFKEKFEKKAAQVEIVYSSHSEDDELYKDDKYRDQIRLPEEYEKRLHNVKHNISVRYDDSTIRARIKRYKELLHLRKRYLNIPCIKKYLASSFIPEHLKTMLKQMKKRNLFSMNLEHTAYAMTISLKRIFEQRQMESKKRRESSTDYIKGNFLESEKGVNIYAITPSGTTTSGMDEYKEETQSFLEDIHYNWDKFQMKYFRDKKLQLIKQLTQSIDDIAKPKENFDLIKELKTKRGKLKSYQIVNALELKEEWEKRNKKLSKEKRLQFKKQMQDAHKETEKDSRELKSLGIEEMLLLAIPETEKELASETLDPDLILISEFAACVKRKDFQKEYMKFIEEKSRVCYGTDVNEGDEELMLVGKESDMMIVSDQEGVKKFSERLFEEKMLLLLTKGKYTLHQIKLKPYLKYYIKLWRLHTKMYSDATKYDDTMINGKFIGILNPDKFERFKRMQTLFMEPKETFWMNEEQREQEKFECELTPSSQMDLDSLRQDESLLVSEENSQSLKESLPEEEEEEEDSRELEQELAGKLKPDAIPCLKDKPQEVRATQDKIEKPKINKTTELGCQQVRNVGPLITLIKKSRNLRSKHWTYPERKFLKSFLCERDHFSSVKLKRPCYGLLKNDKEFHTADVILYKMLKLMKNPLQKFMNTEAAVSDQKNSEESTDTDEEVLQFLGKTSFSEVTWEDIEKNFLREFINSRGFLLGKQEMLVTEEGCKDKQMYDIRRFLYQDLLYRVPRKREQICPVEVKRAISEATPQVDEIDWEKYKVATPPKATFLSDEEILFEADAKEMELQGKKGKSAFYKHLFCYRAPVPQDPIKLARKESVLIPKEELGLPRFNFSIPFKIKSSPEMLPPRASRVHH